MFVSVIRDKTTNDLGRILLACYALYLLYLAPLMSTRSGTTPFSTIVRSCTDEQESRQLDDPASMCSET
jgi:hypothetical protein